MVNASISASFYASRPFKFIVEGHEYHIHTELVSRHSKPLDRMMNGAMMEAQKGYAVLNEVDGSTFVRFMEWAYQGHYTAGEFVHRPTAEEEMILEWFLDWADFDVQPAERSRPLPPPLPAWMANWSSETIGPNGEIINTYDGKYFIQVADIFGPVTTQDEVKQLFMGRLLPPRLKPVLGPRPRPNRSPGEDYTDVFLSHAQLYVFAEKYDIQTLRLLALNNLHAVLAVFTLYKERTGDIIALLRYVYTNTCGPVDGAEERLRTLLTLYMGFEMETLMKDENFQRLMIEDGGDLLGDFMKMVEERVRGARRPVSVS